MHGRGFGVGPSAKFTYISSHVGDLVLRKVDRQDAVLHQASGSWPGGPNGLHMGGTAGEEFHLHRAGWVWSGVSDDGARLCVS